MNLELATVSSRQYSETVKQFYVIDSCDTLEYLQYQFCDRFGEPHRTAAYHWSVNGTKLVVLVHGYLDNAAYLKPLQRWFLAKGFDLLCIELPGHGESSGARGDIAHFNVYQDVYQAIFPRIFELSYDEFVFYGHSTGNVGIIELLLDHHPHRFSQIIMATPLIRSWQWSLSTFAWRIAGRMVKKIPRRSLQGCDPEYQCLRKLDGNLNRFAPTHWFSCLQQWNKMLEVDSRTALQPIDVIFAGKDTVIDTAFNKNFIEARFKNAQIVTVEGSDHILHYEKLPVRNHFFGVLQSLLFSVQ